MEWFKSLFGIRRKASAARSLFAIERPGRAVWSARRFDSFADEGYAKNVIAFSAINTVAEAAASLPWQLFRNAGAKRVAVAEHPLLSLLARPNPWSGGPALLAAVYGYRQIAGNAYIEAVSGDGDGGGGPPVELYTLRPDRMSVIAGSAGSPAAYRFTVGGRSRDFPVDPIDGRSAILHFKTFHPLDDWYGLSPLEAAAYAVDQHNQAGAWNQALLQNGARPSGALMVRSDGDGAGTASGALDDDQFERLRSQIDQLYSGPRNAGRPLLLEGGLTWQEMSLSPKDMARACLSSANRRCAVRVRRRTRSGSDARFPPHPPARRWVSRSRRTSGSGLASIGRYELQRQTGMLAEEVLDLFRVLVGDRDDRKLSLLPEGQNFGQGLLAHPAPGRPEEEQV